MKTHPMMIPQRFILMAKLLIYPLRFQSAVRCAKTGPRKENPFVSVAEEEKREEEGGVGGIFSNCKTRLYSRGGLIGKNRRKKNSRGNKTISKESRK